MSIMVGTSALRQALVAVVPHAHPDKDFTSLHRVHFDIGAELAVSATNRYTAAYALVQVDEHDGEVTSFDLSPQDVKEILALFKSSKEPGVAESLRLDITDTHTTVTDVSGLFEGKRLALPRYADELNFPNIPRLLAAALSRPVRGSERLVANGEMVGLFTAAGKAYGDPLVVEPTGANAAFVVSCADSFIGVLMPIRQDDDADEANRKLRRAWVDRLPEADWQVTVSIDLEKPENEEDE